MMESRRLHSNALHDLGVRLQRSNKHGIAFDTFGDSLQMRMASIKFDSTMEAESSQETEEKAQDEEVELCEKYQKTVRELQKLRNEQDAEEEDGGDDLSRSDLFPLTNDPNSAFFLPPVPRLVELGSYGQDALPASKAPPSQNAESARTLLNMALCHLSKTHADLDKAEQYLSMASQVLPDSPRDKPLLAADVTHAEAITALASGSYYEAEIGAAEALRLYSNVAFGILRRADVTKAERRRAKEGAADALSLLLRVYHLTSRHSEGLSHFDELIRLRVNLYGSNSIRVATTMYNLGIVLASMSGSGSVEAREFIKALAYHPSLIGPLQQHSQLGSRIRIEAARALNAVNDEQETQDDGEFFETVERTLGTKFHAHAGAA